MQQINIDVGDHRIKSIPFIMKIRFLHLFYFIEIGCVAAKLVTNS